MWISQTSGETHKHKGNILHQRSAVTSYNYHILRESCLFIPYTEQVGHKHKDREREIERDKKYTTQVAMSSDLNDAP
jgi:hypothetical protein